MKLFLIKKSRFCLTVIFLFLLLIIFSNKGFANPYGKTVIALYKSSEKYTKENNPIKRFFEKEILKLGLKIKYLDFDNGLSINSDYTDVRAILTWYNSGMVKNKDISINYCKYLLQAQNLGIKLLIVNSFGAYGYKENGKEKWDLINYINPVYQNMGFIFKGFWTNDTTKLKITINNSKMAEYKARQNLKLAKHYQQIIPILPDIKTYLQITRTDRQPGLGDGKSSVILTSPYGGFALEQYVLQKNKLLINPGLFLKEALFFDNNQQKIGIIIGNLDNKSFVKKNLYYACLYAKINSENIDLNDLNRMLAYDLKKYQVLLIAADSEKELPLQILKKYVKQGGKIAFLNSFKMNKIFADFLGIKNHDADIITSNKGFKVTSNFYMNQWHNYGQNISFNLQRINTTNSKILIKALESGKKFPFLIEKKLGKGKILYFNTRFIFSTKGMRGTIIQSIHYLHNNFVSGLANISMMMIDDFPAPLWNMNYRAYRLNYYQNQLKEETDPENRSRLKSVINNLKKYKNNTDVNFIRNTWIRDMQQLQQKLKFNYSSYIIFNYNNNTTIEKGKPFEIKDFYLAEGLLPLKNGYKVVENGWELGLHGFNHMSLTRTRPKNYNSNPWPDYETMAKALTIVKKEWEKIYNRSTLPFSYVAPHNIIDDTGLKALGNIFHSIKVVCTLYMADGNEREQEFEWTKDQRFFQIPRITAGYMLSANDKVILNDAMHNFGVISHFIHPDDVFDETRSYGYKGWQKMKKDFTHKFSKANKDFPWLRWMTVKDAFFEFQFYNNTNFYTIEKPKKLIIKSSDGSDKYLFLRLRLKKTQKVKRLVNCKKVYQNKKTGDLVIKTNQHHSEIVFR